MVNNYFGIYVQALLAKNSVAKLQKELNAIKGLQVKVTPVMGTINKDAMDKMVSDFNNKINELQKQSSEVNLDIDTDNLVKSKKEISDVGKALDNDLIPSVDNAKQEFNGFDNFIHQAGQSFDNLLGIVSKVAVWGIATNAVYGTKRAIEELFQTYVELEDKLISIERVTNNFNMEEIFDGSYQSAQKYGSSLNDMLGSVEEIARSYSDLTEKEVLAAAEAGILASTIAEMDGQDAVGAIIAVSNAYDLAIENGERLIDIANEVDNNFSVTATDIATAWEKSAATAKTFGVEIQNLTGYIAAISTVTQESGAVIGNSLKTIFSRITTMDDAISAIKNVGIDVFDSTTGDARAVEDILEDLAGKWDDLSDAERQNLGVKVAGRYQLTRFLALMDNWNIAVEASATALNSEGSAARENAKYLESYTAKLTQLENSQAALSEAIFNSQISGWGKAWIELKIALTDAATSFFSVCDAMTVLLGLLPTLLALLSQSTNGYKLLKNALMFLMQEEQAEIVLQKLKNSWLIKNAAGEKMAAISTQLHTKAQQTKVAAVLASEIGEKKLATTNYLLAAAENVAAAGAKVLSVALNMIPGMAIATVLGFIVSGLTNLFSSSEEAATGIEDLNAEFTELDNSIADVEKYRKVLTSTTSSVEQMAEAKEGLKTIQDQLIEQYGKEAEGIDLVNGNIDEQLKKLKQLKQEQAQDYVDTNKSKYNTANDKVYGKNNYKRDMLIGTGYVDITDYDYMVKNKKMTEAEADVYRERLANAKQFDKDLYDIVKKYSTSATEADVSGFISFNTKSVDNSKKALTELREYFIENEKEIVASGAMSQESFDWRLNEIDKELKNIDKKFGSYYETINKVNEQLLTAKGFDFLKEDIAALSQEEVLNEEKINKLIAKYPDLQDALSKNGIKAKSLIKDYQDVGDILSLTADKYDENSDSINDFLKEAVDLKDTNSLTKDTVSELLDKYEGLEQIFKDAGYSVKDIVEYCKEYNGTLYPMISNTNSLSEAIKQLDENINSIQSAYSTCKDAIAEYNENGYFSIDTMQSLLALDERYLLALQNENGQLVLNEQSYRNMIDAQLDEAEAAAANSAMLDLETITGKNTGQTMEELRKKYANLQTELDNTTISYDQLTEAAAKARVAQGVEDADDLTSKIMSVYSSRMEIIKKTRNSISSSNATFAKSMGVSNKTTQKTINYYEKAEEALLGYKNAVDAIDNELKILQEQQKRNIEGSNAWFNNYQQQEQVVRRYQSAINTYIQQIEIQMRNDKLTGEEKTKLANKIQDLRLEYEKLNTVIYDNIEAQKEFYKGEIENKLDSIKDLEDKRHNDALDHIKKEREAFKKQIDEQLNLIQKAKDARSYENDLKELQEQRLDILNQIARLEGDDSRLAQSKLKDLYDELEDLDSDLSDLNYDRDVEIREGALEDLETQMEEYYDRLEEIEDEKNALIEESLEDAKDSLDKLNWTIGGLKNELNKWTNNLSSFSHWADGFDALVSTMPQQNIVSASMPVTTLDENGNPVTTEITFQITGSSKDATDIASQVVESLKQAGVIVNKN